MRKAIATDLAASLVAVGLLFASAAPTTAAMGEPIKGKPKIVSLDGFVFPVRQGQAWRVGALMVSRYPKVLPRHFPAQVRKLLTFRARGQLKVRRHHTRIASRHASGGLPVAVEGRSLYYAHLLLFSVKQSGRILALPGALGTLGGDPGPAVVRSEAAATELVKARGQTLARASAETQQRVALGAQSPPPVVNGCVIEPHAQCAFANLRSADLSRAQLSGADLYHADLSDADLSTANLSDANLAVANLSYAGLGHANLTGANLAGANLTGANLTGAYWCRTTMPNGSINSSSCGGG